MKNAPPAPVSRVPDWAGLAARVLLGLLLIVSGTLKASSPSEEFSVVIEAYQLVPLSASLTLATFLPWVEVLLGFCLLFGFLTGPAAAASGAFFLAFLGALLSTKARGINLPNCGCFGMGWHPSTNVTMAIDAVSFVLALLAFKKGAALASLDAWAARGEK